VRIRDDDHRPDELLAEAGRTAARLQLAIGWTSGIRGEKAKQASDTGPGAWKNASVFTDPGNAAGYFVQRCRTRNPVVVASKSGLVLLEVDGPLELLERFGISIPETVVVRSMRGWHFWMTPPDGKPPAKIQVSADGVVVSGDGYLVCPPALHPSGHVYRYEETWPWAS
jgi:hypothetical protein